MLGLLKFSKYWLSNLLNTSHMGEGISNYLLPVKITKLDKQKSVCQIKIFWLVQLMNFHIYNNFRLHNGENNCKDSLHVHATVME